MDNQKPFFTPLSAALSIDNIWSRGKCDASTQPSSFVFRVVPPAIAVASHPARLQRLKSLQECCRAGINSAACTKAAASKAGSTHIERRPRGRQHRFLSELVFVLSVPRNLRFFCASLSRCPRDHFLVFTLVSFP